MRACDPTERDHAILKTLHWATRETTSARAGEHIIAGYRVECAKAERAQADAEAIEFIRQANAAMRYFTGERDIEQLIERYEQETGEKP